VQKIILTVFSLIVYLFILNTPTFADFTFSTTSQTIASTDELELPVNISLSGQANKIYYLEGAFKKDGTSSYFGLTFNDTDWVSYTSSNFASLKKITTDSQGLWNGHLKVKIDDSSNLFTGTGDYILTLKRFTEAGSASWSDNSTILSVSAPLQPSPEPTPLNQSPSPSSSPSQGSTASSSFFISSESAQITSDEQFLVDVSLQNLDPSTNYFIKAAFFKEGSTNYFGKTLVGGSWVKNSSTYSSQVLITTDNSGSYNGSLQIMVDMDDSGYDGSGDYKLKIGRYNSAGSGPTWSNILGLYIDNVAVPTNSPSASPKSSTSPIPSISSKTITSTDKKNSTVLGESLERGKNYSEATLSSKFSASDSDVSQIKDSKGLPNYWFLGGGVFSLGAGGAAVFTMYRKNKIPIDFFSPLRDFLSIISGYANKKTHILRNKFGGRN
jgi:hypothetical protein